MDARRAIEILRMEREATRRVFTGLDELFDSMSDAVSDLCNAIKGGAVVLVGGNGGSAAMASHFAGELTGRFLMDRKPIPAVCLNADDSVVTCIANDYGYAETLARGIESFRRIEKYVILFSTSGKSKNVLKALEYMELMEIKGILLTSESCEMQSDLIRIIRVNANRTSDIQLMHQFLMHCMCVAVDENLADKQ